METNNYIESVIERIDRDIKELNGRNKSLEERVRKLEGFKSRVIGAIVAVSVIGTVLYWFKDLIFK